MLLPNRLTSDPAILSGKPIVKGSRISAELILELLAAGMTESEILDNYPGIVRDDVLACLEYARQLAHSWKSYQFPA